MTPIEINQDYDAKTGVGSIRFTSKTGGEGHLFGDTLNRFQTSQHGTNVSNLHGQTGQHREEVER